MSRLAFWAVVGSYWAAVATGCLGGQTGQPGSLDCGATQLSPTATWGDTTVQAAAQVFERSYTAGLVWQAEPRGSTLHTPVDLQDSVQLTLAYGGAKARRDCADQLQVPVLVTLITSASGIAETGAATLTIDQSAQGLIGTLHYEGTRIRLDANLTEGAPAQAPVGSFDALDPNLPGASASFTEEP
jgi:hypothetical protein